MHLADCFIQSNLHCIYSMLHSLGIKPMTLTLLVTALLFKLHLSPLKDDVSHVML